MTRSLLAALAALLLPLSLLAAPVPAGTKTKDITELPVAANAMAVIQLNGIDRTKERLAKMIEGIDPATAKDLAGKLDEQIKTLTEGRDLAGIDVKGRVFLAVGLFAEVANADGPFALMLPTPDYKTFRDKFLTKGEQKSFTKGKDGVDEFETESGKTYHLVDIGGGYVLATPNKATAEGYAGKYDKLTVKKLGTLADAFLSADLALFVNMTRVVEEYGPQIAQARAFVPQILALAGGQLEPGQIEVFKVVVDGLFQVVEDATGIVIGLEAKPEGFGLRIEAGFTDGSISDKALAAELPTSLKSLDALPKGRSTYTASKWGKSFAALQRKLSAEFNSNGDDDAENAITKLSDLLAEESSESVSVSGADFTGVSATTTASADKISAARLKVFQLLPQGAKYSNLVLKAKPKVTEKAQTHAGFTLHSAAIEVDYEASVKATADEAQKELAIAAMKKLMPEKQTLWFGSDGKRMVQLTGKDWDAAKKALDEFVKPTAPTADDKAFSAARKQLPDDASYIMLADAVQLIGSLADYAGSLGSGIPGGPELPKLGKVTGDPAYLGVSFVTKKGSARFDLFVPVAAVKTVMKSAEEGAKDKKKD